MPSRMRLAKGTPWHTTQYLVLPPPSVFGDVTGLAPHQMSLPPTATMDKAPPCTRGDSCPFVFSLISFRLRLLVTTVSWTSISFAPSAPLGSSLLIWEQKYLRLVLSKRLLWGYLPGRGVFALSAFSRLRNSQGWSTIAGVHAQHSEGAFGTRRSACRECPVNLHGGCRGSRHPPGKDSYFVVALRKHVRSTLYICICFNNEA